MIFLKYPKNKCERAENPHIFADIRNEEIGSSISVKNVKNQRHQREKWIIKAKQSVELQQKSKFSIKSQWLDEVVLTQV